MTFRQKVIFRVETTTIRFTAICDWPRLPDWTSCRCREVETIAKLLRSILFVAATSLRAGFQVYLSKLWVADVTKALRYDLLVCCFLSQIIWTFLLLQPLLELGSKSTSLSSGFSDVIKAVRYDLLKSCFISFSGDIPGSDGWMDTIVRCGRCLAGGRGCLLKGPHLIPSLNFRLPYLTNVHQLISPFLLLKQGMEYCPWG